MYHIPFIEINNLCFHVLYNYICCFKDILPQGSLMAMYPDVDPESAAKEANKDNNNKGGGGGGKVEVVAKKKKESAPPPPPKPKVPKNINEAVKVCRMSILG